MAKIFHGFKWHRILFLVNALCLVFQCVIWMISRDHTGGEGNSEHVSLGVQGRGTARGTPDEVKARGMPPAWNDNWDGKHLNGNSTMVSDSAVAKRHLYLIRHGQYYRDTGKLTPLGTSQAHALGKRLKSLSIRFDRYVVSTSKRAVHTSDVVHPYVPYVDPEYTALLKEGSPNYPDFAPGFWDPNDDTFRRDGLRLARAFKSYVYRASANQRADTNELFIVHGNVIAYFVLRALQLSERAWLRVSVFQASITRLDILPSGQVYLKVLGDVGHLSPQQWTDR